MATAMIDPASMMLGFIAGVAFVLILMLLAP